jgi:hypothetical protein
MISNCKLPFAFDPKLLQSDLEQLAPDDWTAHFNVDYYEGDWAGVALRSVGGVASQLYSDPRAEGSLVDTPILDRCPNVRAGLALFKCPLRSVRFLRLAAGSTIREHRDFDLGYEEGLVRLHVPIISNADVVFFLDAHRIEMNEGECWYLDLSLPHWVENRSAVDRIHLVIDCEVNEWLRELLATAESTSTEGRTALPAHEECPPSPAELERFRQVVFGDLNLQQRLRVTADRESFSRLVVSVGRDGGYRFTLRDVEEALRAARRTWIERWIH